MGALNNAQLEILKLFKYEKTDEELAELKQVLVDYLFNKAIAEADKVHLEKGYTTQDVEQWKDEHTRLKPAKSERRN